MGCREHRYPGPVTRRAKPSTKADCEVGACPLVTTAARPACCPALRGGVAMQTPLPTRPHTPQDRQALASLARVVASSRTTGPSFGALARILQREQWTREQCSPGPRGSKSAVPRSTLTEEGKCGPLTAATANSVGPPSLWLLTSANSFCDCAIRKLLSFEFVYLSSLFLLPSPAVLCILCVEAAGARSSVSSRRCPEWPFKCVACFALSFVACPC